MQRIYHQNGEHVKCESSNLWYYCQNVFKICFCITIELLWFISMKITDEYNLSMINLPPNDKAAYSSLVRTKGPWKLCVTIDW